MAVLKVNLLEHRLTITLVLSLLLQLSILFLFRLDLPERTLSTMVTTIDLVNIQEQAIVPEPPREVIKTVEPEADAIPVEKEVAIPQTTKPNPVFLPFYQVENLPTFKARSVPVYPERARKLGRTSQVLLEAYIDSQGLVQRVVVLKSGGNSFDQAAIAALKQSTFVPAMIMGKAVAVKIRVPYVFELKK